MAFHNNIVIDRFKDISRHVGRNILMHSRQEIVMRRNPQAIKEKTTIGLTRDIVTTPDTLSERYIVANILALDEDLTLVGEETGRRIDTEQPCRIAVIFDPLDGSDSYAQTLDELLETEEYKRYREEHRVRFEHGDFDKYTVHLMYVVGDELRAAVTYSPERDLITVAEKGKGAYMYVDQKSEGVTRLTASRKEIVSSSVISDSYLPPKPTPEYRRRFSPVLEKLGAIKTNFRRFGYTSAVYEALSTTFPDNHPDARALYIGPHVYIWEVPILTLREAGADALVIREKQGRFKISLFDIKDFRIYDPASDRYKEPFFVIIGEREMLGRLEQKFFGDLPRYEKICR